MKLQNNAKNPAKKMKKYIEKRMPHENEAIAKKGKLIQLLTKKCYEYSETKKKNVGKYSYCYCR